MKLLLDQNLAKRLVIALQTTYPGTQHVRELNLDTATDEEIWQYAKTNNLTIVSKDSDFFHRSMLSGHPPKVVRITLGNCKTDEILTLLLMRLDDLMAFDNDDDASFLALP
jgi:predicted nuclease of predicted toxin-antitoxin system